MQDQREDVMREIGVELAREGTQDSGRWDAKESMIIFSLPMVVCICLYLGRI